MSVPVIKELSKGRLVNRYGEFEIHVFHDGNEQAIAITAGELGGGVNVICRIHSECFFSQVLFSDECDCIQQLHNTFQLIKNAGRGIIIYLYHEGRGNGLAARVAAVDLKAQGKTNSQAYKELGFKGDNRSFIMAVKIIKYFQINSVIFFGANTSKITCLEENGIKITEIKYGIGSVVLLGPKIRDLINATNDNEASPIFQHQREMRRVFILGDLNIDYYTPLENKGGTFEIGQSVVGGTGYNAAVAFKDKGLLPIVFGKVGMDPDGDRIINELRNREITSLIGQEREKATGKSFCFYDNNSMKATWISRFTEQGNANDYDVINLEQAMALTALGSSDIVFLTSHPIIRYGLSRFKEIFDVIHRKNVKIILDLVPHPKFEDVKFDALLDIIKGKVSLLIGEYPLLLNFLDTPKSGLKKNAILKKIIMRVNVRYLMARDGVDNISKQTIIEFDNQNIFTMLEDSKDTGFSSVDLFQRKGFGDKLAAEFLSKNWEGFLNDI